MSNRDSVSGASIVFVVAALVGMLVMGIASNRAREANEREQADLNLFLEASSAGWAQATEQFFTVPESAAQTIATLSIDAQTNEDLIDLLAATIRPARALDGAFLGYPDGSFVFVARSDEVAAGGWRTRTISFEGGERKVELTWTDASLKPLRTEVDEADTYDPRKRPWYISADSSETELWTAPYVFASSQQPGITHSSTIFDDDGERVAVVGIDMRLTELGEFLDELAPRTNGEALVVDEYAQVIAASTMQAPSVAMEGVENILSADNTDALVEVIEELKVNPEALSRQQSPDGLRTTVTRPARTSPDWYLAVQASHDDFFETDTTGSLTNLLRSLALGIAAAGLTAVIGFSALRYRQSLKIEAEQDELTKVLSRRAFKRILVDRLRERDELVVAAIIDLDRFKAVNDEHGHAAGDAVLTQVGARIQSFANVHGAAAGRLGGDEFAIVAAEELDWMQLIADLVAPIKAASNEFDVGASIGVAVAKPGHHRSSEDLLREADQALFHVKRAGGGAVHVSGATTTTT